MILGEMDILRDLFPDCLPLLWGCSYCCNCCGLYIDETILNPATRGLVVTSDFLQAKESWDLSNEDKVELAKKRKEHGNALFKAGKWAHAITKYKSAADTVGYDVSHPHYISKRGDRQATQCLGAPQIRVDR